MWYQDSTLLINYNKNSNNNRNARVAQIGQSDITDLPYADLTHLGRCGILAGEMLGIFRWKPLSKKVTTVYLDLRRCIWMPFLLNFYKSEPYFFFGRIRIRIPNYLCEKISEMVNLTRLPFLSIFL